MKALKQLPSEKLARKHHNPNSDAEALAKHGGTMRPSFLSEHRLLHDAKMKKRRQVMGKIGNALLVLLAAVEWFAVGALAGVQI